MRGLRNFVRDAWRLARPYYRSDEKWSAWGLLASILALTATGTTLMQGETFLLIYALGLGTPYLLVGLFIDRIQPVVRTIKRYTGPICTIGGAVLVLTGMLILSGRLDQLANFAPLFKF